MHGKRVPVGFLGGKHLYEPIPSSQSTEIALHLYARKKTACIELSV
nr:MAG TPA: hypothetical protein [Caudoviricetes sp.]